MANSCLLANSVGRCGHRCRRCDVRRLDRAPPVGIEPVAMGDAPGYPPHPGWLSARAADRWAFRGGLGAILLLLAAAWLIPSPRNADAPATLRCTPGNNATSNPRARRHIDAELKNAILVHVPKTKQVRLVVLSGDMEADQFAWEIDAFLRAEGYPVTPRMLFAMAAGGTTPNGTTIIPTRATRTSLSSGSD